MVRCKDEMLEAYVAFIGYAGSDGATVRYRFDSGEVVSGFWTASQGGEAVFSQSPSEFARAAMTASNLSLEVDTEFSTPRLFRFSMTGSGAAIGRVLDLCGVPRVDAYTPDNEVYRRVASSLDEDLARRNVSAVALMLKALQGYDGPQDDVRRPQLYVALSRFWVDYWDRCERGEAMGESCASWISSRRYDADADYPNEVLAVLLERYKAASALADDVSDDK